MAPIFEQLGEKMQQNRKILVAHIDWTTNSIPAISIEGYPTVKLFKQDGEIVEYEGDRSLGDMARFLKEASSFPWVDLGIPIDEAPDPHTMDGVFSVTKETFDEEVLQSKQDVLLELYTPWCGHCRKLQPIYARLNQKLRSNRGIRVLKADKSKHNVPVPTTGFPTIVFFRKGSSPRTITYEGDRSLKSLLEFLKENTSFEWVEPARDPVL
jgi:protein disulfide-isomerase-like protein